MLVRALPPDSLHDAAYRLAAAFPLGVYVNSRHFFAPSVVQHTFGMVHSKLTFVAATIRPPLKRMIKLNRPFVARDPIA